METRGRKEKVWAVYRGDEFIFEGTTSECADHLGLSVKTIRFYSTPAYMQRPKNENSIVLVDLTDI